MRASGSATIVLLAIAVTGCGPVFGVETPAWLSNAPATPHIYDGVQAHGPGALYDGTPVRTPIAPVAPVAGVAPIARPSVVELRAPAVIVVRAPPGGGPDTYVNVTCVAPPEPAPVSGYRPSPYGDVEEQVVIRPPYKPSPYEDMRPPRLYRDD